MPVSTRVAGLAINPGKPHTLHLTEIDLPPVGRSDAEVRVLRIGICGTDRELIEGRFGRGPDGCDELVVGHEVIGVVERIGDAVTTVKPGDIVAATARRGCGCDACRAGESDFCSTLGYRERGIVGLHGYFTERFVEDVRHLVVVPHELEHIGVLVEPTSVLEKTWRVANGVQSRIRSWRPRTAIVYGAGPIGLLGTLVLRANGLDVFTFDLKPAPNRNEEIVRLAGATYVCAAGHDVAEMKRELPNIDLIIECTGSSRPLPDAMRLLGNNGVLVLLSGTAGQNQQMIPIDEIYRQFVLGNKVMVGSVNSSIADFEAAVRDLARFEQIWPGLATRLITHRVPGLAGMLELHDLARDAVKAVIEMG